MTRGDVQINSSSRSTRAQARVDRQAQWRGDGRWRGDHRRHFRHRNVVVFGFGAPYYSDYAYSAYPYDSCYQEQQVRTRYGWRWVTANVCGDY